MIRVVVTYKGRDPELFFLDYQTTVEKVRSRFFGPYPLTLQTTKGSKTVQWEEVDKVYIQEMEHGRIIGKLATIDFAEEGMKMSNEDVAQEVAVEPEPEPVSTPVEEVVVEDKKVAVDAKILNEKFRSFREKFLELERSQESWESQIIEKMAAREGLLKTFAETIDEENSALDAFKSDKVGS